MVEPDSPPVVDVAICIDGEAYSRLWNAVRHLCVGLVDSTPSIRLVSSSPEVEALTLGPIQMIVHQNVVWPVRRQRLRQIIEVLSPRPPTTVHAISAGSYGVGQAIAEAFEADLVLQVTADADVPALERVVVEREREVIASSGPLRDMVQASGLVPGDSLAVIRTGALRSEKPACFRQPKGPATIVCSADFDKSADIEQLIRAIRLLRDRGHDVLLFLLGRGRQERKLRELADAQGVAPLITFARPKADPALVLAGADIFVSPGPERAISCHSLLAMAAGTAVVSCAGGVTDHCIDGQTAVVCREPEADSMAEGLERLLRDRDFARTLAVAGIAHIKQYHSVSMMADQTLELYQRVAARRKTYAIKE